MSNYLFGVGCVVMRVYGVVNLYDMRPSTWRGVAVCGQRRCRGLVNNMEATRGDDLACYYDSPGRRGVDIG